MIKSNTTKNQQNSNQAVTEGLLKLAKHPQAKIVLCLIALYGVVYLSKYIFNTTAGSIRAVKNLISAIKE